MPIQWKKKKCLRSGREAENSAGGTGRHYSGIGTVQEVWCKSCDVLLLEKRAAQQLQVDIQESWQKEAGR